MSVDKPWTIMGVQRDRQQEFIFSGYTMREQDIIKRAKLPTLSKTLQALADLERRNPVNHTQEFTRIVHMDPALSAHILRVANSPQYGMAAQIRSIGHAVTLLGIRTIRNLAFSQSITEFFRRIKPGNGVGKTFHDILKKTLLTAAVAQTLAQREDLEADPEEIYASALLTEVGQIILFLHDTQTYRSIHALDEATLIERETASFGCDHVSLGLAFVTLHGFPDSFRTALQNHVEGPDLSVPSRILRTANLIAQWLLCSEESHRGALFERLTRGGDAFVPLTPSDMGLTFPLLLEVMERLLGDFPEIQSDLATMIRRGGEWITQLLQQEVADQELHQQLREQNQQIGEEKSILFHLLQIASRLSTQAPLEETVRTLVQYGARLLPESRWSLLWHKPSEEAPGEPRFCSSVQPHSPTAPANLLPLWQKGALQADPFPLSREETERIWPPPAEVPHAWAIPVRREHFFLGILLTAWSAEPHETALRPFSLLAHLLAQTTSNHLAMDALWRETEKKDRLIKELQAIDVPAQGAEPDSEVRNQAALATLPVVFHKLKNRLTPVLGYTQILLQRAGEENDRKRLQKIEANSEELHRLLNLLRTTLPQTPSLPLRTTDLTLAFTPLLEAYQAQNPQIRWSVPAWDQSHLVQIHPGSWRLLWQELLDNALLSLQIAQKSGRQNPPAIALSCTPEEKHLLFELRDNGLSVDSDQVTRLGDPFVSFFEGGHAGLGLVLARWHAQQNRAELLLEEEKGGQFVARLRVPLHEDLLSSSSRHLIMIDDEPILLDLMQDFLRDVPGLRVHAFSDAAAARHYLRHHAFDLVISDVHMPDVDGVAIQEALSALGRNEDLIWITGGQLSERQLLLARRHGIPLLYKPFSLLQFRDLILRNLYKEDKHV